MHRKIPLPRGWNRRAKSAILHILALSHYTFTALIARAANDRDQTISSPVVREPAFLFSEPSAQRSAHLEPGPNSESPLPSVVLDCRAAGI